MRKTKKQFERNTCFGTRQGQPHMIHEKIVLQFESEISVNTGGTPMLPWLLRLTRFSSNL
jgi:hypothetical protein